ncbi:uncharacterized protein LOC113206992 isoform X2 [Frankliniella occidentalis]|uniref:Uncharacterized protein LOC113206992 isoform X2 n=1 Tax=Frankliniella occidentalis TaxID=133901 RepID=A0A9C6WVD0_FRAOC|nr:uncharacterized protein LOC113206992 isoform X2 [Frankliniella occidentalis]
MEVSLLIVALLSSGPCYGEMLAGPYSIIPERAEACPEGILDLPFPIDFHLTRDRHNQNIWFVYANMSSFATLNDEKEAHLAFASWSSRGGWKENALTMKFKRPCTQCKQYLPGVWSGVMSVLESSTKATDCPFPPGIYTINNVSSASIAPPKAVPVFFYGKWRVDIKAVDAKAGRNCKKIGV